MPDPGNVRLKPGSQYRVLLIDVQAERARLFASVMADRGYAVTQTAQSIEAVLDRAGTSAGDAFLSDFDLMVLYASGLTLPEIAGIEKLSAAIGKPLLVATESSDPDAVAKAITAGASFCQPLGVNADRVHAGVIGAIHMHKRLQSLKDERDGAVQALAERKLIDRAKSIVMTSRDYSEQEAFAHLQKLSMTRNTRLADIARSIIDAKELLG